LTTALTEDDKYEGPVPGNHATLKTALTPNSTLVKRIVQIVSDYSRRETASTPLRSVATLPGNAVAVPATSTSTAVPSINSKPTILISCRAHKRTDGETPHPKTGGLSFAVANGEVALRAIQTRAQIMGLLQSGRIDGTEYKEGNRAGRPENRALILGPDFGGAINEPRYLPAFWRYSGRTYQANKDEWATFSNSSDVARPSILILSGLYGLIPFDEYIQNYDCHITDTDVESGQKVVSHWGNTMTDILLSHCDRVEASGMKVGPIIDLLSEASYQQAIDWTIVQKRYPVLHRVFEKRADRDTLVNIGAFLRVLLRDPAKAGQLTADQFTDVPEFIEPDRIAFERELGSSPLSVAGR
jgi:Peroxide stress protein YaaA